MFPLQMVKLKIVEPSSYKLFIYVEPSNGTLCICFPRKWYALELSNPDVAQFVHVSFANGKT